MNYSKGCIWMELDTLKIEYRGMVLKYTIGLSIFCNHFTKSSG